MSAIGILVVLRLLGSSADQRLSALSCSIPLLLVQFGNLGITTSPTRMPACSVDASTQYEVHFKDGDAARRAASNLRAGCSSQRSSAAHRLASRDLAAARGMSRPRRVA